MACYTKSNTIYSIELLRRRNRCGVSYHRIHKLSARYNVFGRRIARHRASVSVAPPLDASGR